MDWLLTNGAMLKMRDGKVDFLVDTPEETRRSRRAEGLASDALGDAVMMTPVQQARSEAINSRFLSARRNCAALLARQRQLQGLGNSECDTGGLMPVEHWYEPWTWWPKCKIYEYECMACKAMLEEVKKLLTGEGISAICDAIGDGSAAILANICDEVPIGMRNPRFQTQNHPRLGDGEA
jgi:hypothetical protein